MLIFVFALYYFSAVGCFGQSLDEVCGISKYPDAGRVPVEGGRTRRIVGGVPARENEYPWVILMDWFDGNNWDQNCGAVLIDNRWALSARHCTYANDPASDYELYTKNHWRFPSNDGVAYTPEVIIRHPDYDENTYENDLVMFKFPQNLTFDDDLRPICLPPRNDSSSYVGQTVIIAGWGNEERNGPSPEQLLYTDMEVIDYDTCALMLMPDVVFPTTNICVLGNGKDAGDGDSGSVHFYKRPDGRFEGIGIQSWGHWPAGERPSVIVRISEYYDWIDEVRANN
ncbi:unnamed protein product [Owenia fusiformis]|uniref:Uncharacterized protein n=1 Tax=Owenia fusiformis TaxID=6347 RepID=A0A8J1TYS5_OWEFU|nr:unnamed protein product [Owenia fusiformis]